MLDENCIFCKIIADEIPSEKVYEDDWMCVFRDVEPKAKVHLLAVPKTHFKLIEEAGDDGMEMLAYILTKLPAIAKHNGCENGYRLIINQGDDAGQTVNHLHVHILGGQQLGDL